MDSSREDLYVVLKQTNSCYEIHGYVLGSTMKLFKLGARFIPKLLVANVNLNEWDDIVVGVKFVIGCVVGENMSVDDYFNDFEILCENPDRKLIGPRRTYKSLNNPGGFRLYVLIGGR